MLQMRFLRDTGLLRHIPEWIAFQIVANIYHVKSDLTSMMVMAISSGPELRLMRIGTLLTFESSRKGTSLASRIFSTPIVRPIVQSAQVLMY